VRRLLMKRKGWYLLILIFLTFASSSYADHPMKVKEESLYQQLSRAIIRLENDQGVPVGTAFFTIYDGDPTNYYLITARHVAIAADTLRARVPSQHLDTGKTEIIGLKIPGNQWIFHPESGRKIEYKGISERLMPVDVAVAKIPAIRKRSVRGIRYCPGRCSNVKEENQFLVRDPEPPMRILVWGFPNDLGFTLEEQRPFGRLGMVSMKAEEPFIRTDGELRDERVILLDAPLFPGNSGSPVFSYPVVQQFKLAGMVSASNATANLAIAEPVSRISETMHKAFMTKIKITSSWHTIAKLSDNKGFK
jgi:S1-C subfamily serine protease